MSVGTEHDSRTPRRPGRPQSATASRAILDAALELLVEQGYEGMSIEAIAARARVGKATIYRRWPSKQELVSEALTRIIVRVTPPDSGDTRQDLISMLREFQQAAAVPMFGELFHRIVGTAVSNPQFMEIFWRNHAAPRRQAILQVLERARDRGELRPGVDLNLAIDMIAGLVVFRLIFGQMDAEAFRRVPEAVVDAVWNGIACSPSRR